MNYFCKLKIKNRGFTRTPKSLMSGFTLTELIVVMAIATVIMTSIVIQQSKWNDQLVVSTQAYEMSLMIRQAQIYALGVRENVAGTGDKFDVAYGINFDITSPTQYVFFVDKNKSGKLDSEESLETKSLTREVYIQKICAFIPPKAKCSDLGVLSKVSVTFLRPSPNAIIKLLTSSNQEVAAYEPPAIIHLLSPKGVKFYLRIESSGQIYIGTGEPVQ
ncbi:MAG: type II secretion system protein [Patescibacteria group bacterium]